VLVVQASGLAAGKGVLLPTTIAEAEEAIQQVARLLAQPRELVR
jgi:phosphoribosylamine-glycine ligase